MPHSAQRFRFGGSLADIARSTNLLTYIILILFQCPNFTALDQTTSYTVKLFMCVLFMVRILRLTELICHWPCCVICNIQFDDLWKSLSEWLEVSEDNLQKFVIGVGARTKQDFDDLRVSYNFV